MGNFWWTKSREIRFIPGASVFPRQDHLIFIYMLLLAAGQTDEAWEHSKSTAHSEIGKHKTENKFNFCL
jgi:hypothetical protein